MKLVGIDYGRRRIGIAVTDETGEYIRGLPTLDRLKTPDYLTALSMIITDLRPERIVIGLPLDIDGEDTVMSKEVRLFAADLRAKIAVPLCFVDESLSSKTATGLMRSRKKKDRRKKDAVDRLAACLILQSFQEGLTCE
jgi:putative holliday junction resolvase